MSDCHISYQKRVAEQLRQAILRQYEDSEGNVLPDVETDVTHSSIVQILRDENLWMWVEPINYCFSRSKCNTLLEYIVDAYRLGVIDKIDPQTVRGGCDHLKSMIDQYR